MPSDLKINSESNCIVIGNGPSLLEQELGLKIDKFEEIIRFNRFAIKNYEKHVGSKTTIWSTFGRGEKPTDPEIKPERIIFIHGERGNPSFEPKEMTRIPLCFYNNLRDRLKSETVFQDNREIFIPSSGVLVICWLLTHYFKKITIAGFDHFSKDNSSLHHYWVNKKFTKPKEHDGLWEKQIIEDYIKEGKITRLSVEN